MVWLGFGIAWAGYTAGLYGYSLIRGYNLSLAQMVSPVHWYAGKWPPQPAGNTEIIPTGKQSSTQTTALVLANAPPGQATDGSGGGPAPRTSVSIASTATIRAVAATRGWGNGGQWNALTHLINGESGGNSHARNASSGALGIAQALGHGTSCSAGSLGNEYGPQYGLSCKQAQKANSGDATQQVRWMLGYIAARYQTPANAWNTWLSRSPHWY
jgi:hypothetical protein